MLFCNSNKPILRAVSIVLISGLLLSGAGIPSYAIADPSDAALAPPLFTKRPCEIVRNANGSLDVVTNNDVIEAWDKETVRSVNAGETLGEFNRNRWAFVDVGMLIGQMLILTQDKEHKLHNPKDILIPLIKKHIRNRKGESLHHSGLRPSGAGQAEILLEGYDIDGIEEVREGGEITGFSLPITRNGTPAYRLIYNLQGGDTAIPMSDGMTVYVKAEAIEEAERAEIAIRSMRHAGIEYFQTKTDVYYFISWMDTMTDGISGEKIRTRWDNLRPEFISIKNDLQEIIYECSDYTTSVSMLRSISEKLKRLKEVIHEMKNDILDAIEKYEGEADKNGIRSWIFDGLNEAIEKLDDRVEFAEDKAWKRDTISIKELINKDEYLRKYLASAEDINVTVNRRRLLEALENLVNNAIVHGMAKKIEVSIRGKDGFCEIMVMDNGKGIEPSLLKDGSSPGRLKLFELGTTTRIDGEESGLGTAIVWHFVQDHGGTISVESELGKGTTFTIRLPIVSKPAVSSDIRLRFEELRKKYGGKVAWLEIIKELGLSEKLGFSVPQYVPFEKEYLKKLYGKYREVDIDKAYEKISKGISNTPGRYFYNYFLTGKFKVVLFEEFRRTNKEPLSSDEERKGRGIPFTYYLNRLYEEGMTEEEFKAFVGSLLDDEFKSLLAYGRKDEWSQLFCDIRQSPDVKRWKENKQREDPFPNLRVGRIAIDAIEESIKSFIFLKSLTSVEQEEWLQRTKGLPLHRIFRSSNFDEDTFETSMAGAYMSEVTDTFRSLVALKLIMDTPRDLVSDRYLKDASYAAFLQEYITGEKGGVVFSNLCGYTSIESVVGEPSMSVAGLNNTIIDVDKNGRIEDVNYGFYGEPGSIRWDGFDLKYYCSTEGTTTDLDAVELADKIWKKKTVSITTDTGKAMKSPLSEDEIHKVREVALGIESVLGFPVDIEFVFKNGQLYILQVRPITGKDSNEPKALPKFEKSDVIYKVPISIGITPENGYAGFIVAGIEDSRQAQEDLNGFMEKLGLRQGEFIIATSQPMSYRGQPIIIDSGKASRLYHHGIEFRENGTVVAGMPGIIDRDTPGLHWRWVNIDGAPRIKISVEKMRYYSNGFKGVLVKDNASPITVNISPDSERIHTTNFQDTLTYIQAKEDKRAKQAKEEPRPTIVALGTSWITGYEEGRYLQHSALNPLLSSMGKRPQFIVGDDKDLLKEIKKKMGEKGFEKARVIVLAGEETVTKDLAGLNIGNNILLGVDNKYLVVDSYVRVMEMLEIASKLALDPDTPPNSPNIPMERRGSFWVFIPKAEPIVRNYEQLKATYKAQEFA